ncbi:MAG: hypothetical protein NT067_03955 [Candidatus Diapherotrites archaeon]|nr:hypothetical protein [Candidatus Diapherotrites archaeon]
MPQIFDPSDMDIHMIEKPVRAEKLTETENISEGMEKDLAEVSKEKLPGGKRKSAITAILANLVVPGAGCAYLKPNFISITITRFSLILIILSVLAIFLPSQFQGVIFAISLWLFVFIVASWAYLAYLLYSRRKK